jgi:hypothetical protein
MIPTPHYALINTSKGHAPAVVVVNTALLGFRHRECYPWHLRVTIKCRDLWGNGMPIPTEVSVLEKLEDRLTDTLQQNDNAAFLARVTCRGERALIYRVRAPEIASDFLQAATAEPGPVREWEYHMEHDPSWELAEPEFGLVDRPSSRASH